MCKRFQGRVVNFYSFREVSKKCLVHKHLIKNSRQHKIPKTFPEYDFNLILYFGTVVRCRVLLPPTDGQVTPHSCTTSPEYDTTCHFSCPKGYRLHGEPIVTCLSDGQWSKNTTSFCKGWFIFQ